MDKDESIEVCKHDLATYARATCFTLYGMAAFDVKSALKIPPDAYDEEKVPHLIEDGLVVRVGDNKFYLTKKGITLGSIEMNRLVKKGAIDPNLVHQARELIGTLRELLGGLEQ